MEQTLTCVLTHHDYAPESETLSLLLNQHRFALEKSSFEEDRHKTRGAVPLR